MNSPFVGVKEVAQFLGMSAELIYRLADSTKTADPIPHMRLGKKLRFRLDHPDMNAWIERQFAATTTTQGGQVAQPDSQ